MNAIARRRRTRAAAAVIMMVTAGAAPAQEAGETVIKRGPLADDVYLAGRTVQVLGDVEGDVFAAGVNVTVSGSVSGDVHAAGRSVRVSAAVDDDVRAAGADVVLGGTVGDHAILAGGSVYLAPASRVGGRLWAAGGEVNVSGEVSGEALLGGGSVLISGTVDGDVRVAADTLEVVSGAVIGGTLKVTSDTELDVAEDARIDGGVERLPARRQVADDVAGPGIGATAAILLVLAFSAWLAWMLLPRPVNAVLDRFNDRPLLSLGIGLLGALVIPPLALLLLVTVLAAPLGLALLILYPLLIVAAVLTGGAGTGVLLAALAGRDAGAGWLTRAAAVVGGFLALGVAGLIPVAGALVWLLALLTGTGAILGAAWRRAG